MNPYFLLLAALSAAAMPLHAEPPPAEALQMEQAEQLAVARQPMLASLDAQMRAAREQAVAARQLPDPQLIAGVVDLPVDTREAGSLRRDSDTQMQLGLMQEFPRAAKRQLHGELVEREVQRLDAEHHRAWRGLRRDAALAWAQAWRDGCALELARATQREAEVQQQAVEIALKAGRASQADLLTARVEAGRLRDTVAGAEQSLDHARNLLSRWIGDDASRPLPAEPPASPALPPLDLVLARVRAHPHLAGLQAEVAAAQTSADLAQAAYAPDWRVELGYAHRQAYSEEVTLKLGVDLPVFTRNRQDRDLAAALARKDAAEFEVADSLRQLESEARLNHHDSLRLGERIKDYDDHLLPQTQARIEAALASWRSGQGSLAQVLDARRAALDLQMNRLDLQLDALKHSIQLRYLGAYNEPADGGENHHE